MSACVPAPEMLARPVSVLQVKVGVPVFEVSEKLRGWTVTKSAYTWGGKFHDATSFHWLPLNWMMHVDSKAWLRPELVSAMGLGCEQITPSLVRPKITATTLEVEVSGIPEMVVLAVVDVGTPVGVETDLAAIIGCGNPPLSLLICQLQFAVPPGEELVCNGNKVGLIAIVAEPLTFKLVGESSMTGNVHSFVGYKRVPGVGSTCAPVTPEGQ